METQNQFQNLRPRHIYGYQCLEPCDYCYISFLFGILTIAVLKSFYIDIYFGLFIGSLSLCGVLTPFILDCGYEENEVSSFKNKATNVVSGEKEIREDTDETISEENNMLEEINYTTDSDDSSLVGI